MDEFCQGSDLKCVWKKKGFSAGDVGVNVKQAPV